MGIPEVKDEVAKGKTVKFVRFSNKDIKNPELWYVTESGFEFPIPLEDTMGAEFLAKDTALYFMRWIRKHINLCKEASIKETGIDTVGEFKDFLKKATEIDPAKLRQSYDI